jgi:hypothetical protein
MEWREYNICWEGGGGGGGGALISFVQCPINGRLNKGVQQRNTRTYKSGTQHTPQIARVCFCSVMPSIACFKNHAELFYQIFLGFRLVHNLYVGNANLNPGSAALVDWLYLGRIPCCSPFLGSNICSVVAHFCTRIQFVVHKRLQPGHNFFTEQLRVVSNLQLGLASFMPYAVQQTVIAGVALLPISGPQLSVQRETWPPVPTAQTIPVNPSWPAPTVLPSLSPMSHCICS